VKVVNKFGCNAALWCSQSTKDGLEAIKWLESIGNDINCINFNGHSVLHKSAQRGNQHFCKWIICRFERSKAANSLSLISPDAENCCPSDLAGMEGHSQLAEWLARQESEIALCAFTESQAVESMCIPVWLKDGIRGAKHTVNRTNLRGLYESGAGIRRMSAHIVSPCNK